MEDIKDYVKKENSSLLHPNIYVYGKRLISEFQRDGVKFILKLQSHCENITFSGKSRYDGISRKLHIKEDNMQWIFIKIFQNSKTLSVSVENSYSEDQLMHIFLDNFHQGGNIVRR